MSHLHQLKHVNLCCLFMSIPKFPIYYSEAEHILPGLYIYTYNVTQIFAFHVRLAPDCHALHRSRRGPNVHLGGPFFWEPQTRPGAWDLNIIYVFYVGEKTFIYIHI